MHSRIIISSFLILTFYILIPLIPNTQPYAQTPPPPQGPHLSCLNGQAAARLSWYPAYGATSYKAYVDADPPSWNGSCTSPDTCTTTMTNEVTVPIKPGQRYDWWVHSINISGMSQPAMDGFEFTCNIPVPYGIHYKCLEGNTINLNWVDTNAAHLYEVAVDANAPSWDGSCTAPDKCMSVTTNTATITVNPGIKYEYWVQAKDIKGNKSNGSAKVAINCSDPPTPIESPTPVQQISPSLPPVHAQECDLRGKGDANCDGTINLEDSACWEKVFAVNILEVSRGCKYTNFDEADGTNILDFAIWYVHRES